ncbi:50S ribosomal protein L10, partial [Escherichia coli]
MFSGKHPGAKLMALNLQDKQA